MELYLHQDGEQVGPYTEEQIISMVSSGELRRDDIIWHEGLSEWQPIHTAVGLPAPLAHSPKEKTMSNESPPLPGKPNGFDSFNEYASFTQRKDWNSICELNGVELDSFGTKKELNVLADYLEEGEVVFALTSGYMTQTGTSNITDFGSNTWIVVLTNERFLFLDHAMMTSSVDTQSVRHESVQAVSASQGLVFGKIQVDLGARVIVIDNCKKETVKVIADLANKWLRVLKKQTQQQAEAKSKESLDLAQTQVNNQEQIISLLKEIRDRLPIQ